MTTNLMISEKPDAAHKIATALSDKGRIEEHKKKRTRYYTFKRDDDDFIVLPAVGHLFGLKHVDGKGWTYPVFENEWKPVFEDNKKLNYTKQYYKNFENFKEEADNFIICTDWDNEGSVIAYNILRFILKRKNADRMFFTTLTKEELNESFENRKDSVDWGMVNAGLARHKLDWMYGINLTRALTLSLKKERGGFHLLSTGRVQGPTLKILAEKEEEISEFEPEDYWEISVKWMEEYTAYYKTKRLFDEELKNEIREKCKDAEKGRIKEIKTYKRSKKPPVPFNLTKLQTEAYRNYKYNPYITQKIAQTLYTNALISYPRTSSEKLPEKIGYEKIINKLKEQERYKKHSSELLKKELEPREGKKKDKAHTAIYPTGEKVKNLSNREKNVYDLIVKRFFSVFGEKAVKEYKRVKLDVNGYEFKSKGSTVVKPGWMKYYGKYAHQKELKFPPSLEEGKEVKINDFNVEDEETQPPYRYSQAGIVKEMEKRGIGTKATRASIVKKLEDREYIRSESIEVTKLGMGVVKALEEHCPRIISEDLTRKFDKDMDLIHHKKETKEEIIAQAQDILIDISNEFKDNEAEIGEKLNKALEAMWDANSKVGEELGPCPNCEGRIIVVYSKKNQDEFAGCSNYPKCKTIYPLPDKVYKIPHESCKCGAPMIIIGRNEWEACVDRDCGTRRVGKCPECGARLRLMFNKKGSRFVGCSNYPECKKLYDLPNKGRIEFTEEKCKECKSPIIKINGEERCLNKKCGEE